MGFGRYLICLVGKVYCQEDWKKVCVVTNPSVFMLFSESTNSHCGGFFINSQGVGLSVHHFYEEQQRSIEFTKLVYQGKEYKCEVIAESKETHLIVVRANGLENTPFLKLDEELPRNGQEVSVFSINPSQVNVFEPGYVLETGYEKASGVDFGCIRSSCRAGPGYSGGPLMSRSGSVLGLQKSTSSLFRVYDSLAIPSQKISDFLRTVSKQTDQGWEF